jgi:hypothetical protein
MSSTTAAPIGVKELEAPGASPRYDEHSLTMTVERRYHVHADRERALAVPNDGGSTPDVVPLLLLLAEPVARQAVTLYEVERVTRPIPGRPRECEMSVTWEGKRVMGERPDGIWFTGIVNSRFEQTARTDLMLLSYDRDDDGRRLGIGPQNEGAHRFVGQMHWIITQNVSLADYHDRILTYQALIGRVNPEGWVDPVFGRAWEEGAWLYLGPQAAEPRGGAVTLQHVFDYDPDRHFHRWHYHREGRVTVEATSRVLKTALGDAQSSRIYLPCGVDEEMNPDGSPLFDDIWGRPAETTTEPTPE